MVSAPSVADYRGTRRQLPVTLICEDRVPFVRVSKLQAETISPDVIHDRRDDGGFGLGKSALPESFLAKVTDPWFHKLSVSQREAKMDWRFAFRGLKAKYRSQRTEIRALTRALRRDRICVDVGANKGSYLWALSKAVPRGEVVAFEPQPLLAEYLRRACAESGLGNVVIEASGCSDMSGTLSLAIPGGGASSPGASFEQAVAASQPCRFVTVQTVSLDDYFARETRQIGAMKIDVEGHELSVLKGARELISRHKPTIVCECEQRHLTTGSVSDVIEWIESMGYTAYFCKGAELRTASQFIPSVHQRQNGKRFWDAKDYCNNFVFRPFIS